MATLFEKRGRRYVPVQDTEACNGLTDGHWLISVRDGWTSARRLVEPDHAGFVAAVSQARRAMLSALSEAMHLRPPSRPLSETERRAYDAWKAVVGPEEVTFRMEMASPNDIVDAGLKALHEVWVEPKRRRGRPALGEEREALMLSSALVVLCGEEPPAGLVRKWLAGDESHVDTGADTLQDWASCRRPVPWMTGIGLLDAAEALIGEPDPTEELP